MSQKCIDKPPSLMVVFSYMRRPLQIIAALGIASCSCFAAITITPSSYTQTSPHGNFPDSGVKLTDGIIGANDWQNPAGPWVGWLNTDPTITFTFASSVTVNEVRIGFNRDESYGRIFIPQNVIIESTTFSPSSSAIGDKERGFLSFDGAWTGSTLSITLKNGTAHSSPYWIFVDEMTFSAVPEPSTYLAGLSALGMLGLFGWRNRK